MNNPAESVDPNTLAEGEDVVNKQASEAIEPTVIFENIQSLCKEKNIFVSTMEEAAGVPGGTVQNWKQERRWMIHLPAIAQELNVTIDQLFIPANEWLSRHDSMMSIVSALEPLKIDEETARLIIALSKVLVAERDKNRANNL